MLTLTYPKFLQNKLAWFIWKKAFCYRQWHLWDEYIIGNQHYLHCDACGKEIRFKEETHIQKDNQ